MYPAPDRVMICTGVPVSAAIFARSLLIATRTSRLSPTYSGPQTSLNS